MKIIRFLSANLLIGVLLSLTLTTTNVHAQDWWPFAKKKTEVVVNSSPTPRDTKLTTSYAPIVKLVTPSVVTIKTKRNIKPGDSTDSRQAFQIPGSDDDSNSSSNLPQRGLGSGVILTNDGYILTNNHVVEGQDRILVDLPHNKDLEYEAKLVGADPKSDIAVLKIKAKDLPAAMLGDSNQVQVGDVVLAIGNPFGIGQTVTMGIISGLRRNDSMLLGRDSYTNFIQTDAAINMGNSGGPLVDTAGRVIGINTAIISPNSGNLGIGFAIPINMARSIMEQLITHGKVTRGYLGVQIQDMDLEMAESYGRRSSQGVLITKVEPGASADKAHLQRGDIITEVNDEAVSDAESLRLAISSLPPNTSLKIKYYRGNREDLTTAVLGQLPDAADNDSAKSTADASASDPSNTNIKSLGFDIQSLTADVRQSLSLDASINGVIISKVDPNSNAADKGFHRGTIIMEINDKPVQNVKDAVEAIRQSPRIVRLYIWDNDFSRYVALKKLED